MNCRRGDLARIAIGRAAHVELVLSSLHVIRIMINIYLFLIIPVLSSIFFPL